MAKKQLFVIVPREVEWQQAEWTDAEGKDDDGNVAVAAWEGRDGQFEASVTVTGPKDVFWMVTGGGEQCWDAGTCHGVKAAKLDALRCVQRAQRSIDAAKEA